MEFLSKLIRADGTTREHAVPCETKVSSNQDVDVRFYPRSCVVDGVRYRHSGTEAHKQYGQVVVYRETDDEDWR